MNGQSAKPHREVRVGDVIEITRPLGRRQRVVVRGLADQHIPKAEARLLYEDTTPPPSPEEQALLDLMRLAGPRRRRRPRARRTGASAGGCGGRRKGTRRRAESVPILDGRVSPDPAPVGATSSGIPAVFGGFRKWLLDMHRR